MLFPRLSHTRRIAPRRRPHFDVLEDRLAPATFTVTTTLDVIKPADGKVSLREAINVANRTAAPDTIMLPAGVYKIAIPYNPANPNPNASGSFDILASTTLIGAGAGKTFVNGGQIDRVFAVTGTSPSSIGVLFQGLTVRNGLVAGDGGGILVANAGLVVRDSVVTRNQSHGNGGGIANLGSTGPGSVTLDRSRVSGNSARNDGGGLFANTATLTRSLVAGNSAGGYGGGVFTFSTTRLIASTVSGNSVGAFGGGLFTFETAIVTTSTVSGNSTGGDGGGIYADTARLTNSTVSINTADTGGGIYTSDKMILTNSTVSGNSAAVDGGGLFSNLEVRLTNVTITKNNARHGGGVFLSQGGTSSVKNTIIAQNFVSIFGTGPDVSGVFTSLGHNLIGSGSTGFTNGVNGDQVGTFTNPLDPGLGPLANNGGPTLTHALLQGSRAIDHGDNSGAPSTDQRGVARPRDGDGNGSRLVDIGAFEF